MTSAERYARAQEILHDALERRPEERATFVRIACDNDSALRDEVLSLLNAHERASAFLERRSPDAHEHLSSLQARSRISEQGEDGRGGVPTGTNCSSCLPMAISCPQSSRRALSRL